MRLKSLSATAHCFSLFESREQAVKLIFNITKQIGVPAMVIGGAALPNYGYNRSTEDIDLVVTVSDAYKLGDALIASGFQFIGHNKFQHSSGILINLCPTGTKAGHSVFPFIEDSSPGLRYVSLPRLLAMKISAKRLKDRGDFGELVKRNKLSKEYVVNNVLPLLSDIDGKWALELWKQAVSEI
jgi:hypothetical protein